MSEWEEYSNFVASRKKPGAAILQTLTPEKCDLLHMAIGIAGEAGELLDAIKKHIIYDKPLDVENVYEELGDLEFYLEGIRQNPLILMNRKPLLAANMLKLSKRYKSGYSDTAAIDRADKAPEQEQPLDSFYEKQRNFLTRG